MSKAAKFIFYFSLLFAASAQAVKDIKCYITDDCGTGVGGSYSSNPSSNSQIQINPSSVPTEKGFGLEGIFFKGTPDLGIVRGNGRVGAAISPANSEETFFGPPGFENSSDLLYRKMNSEKYPNQKVTLASAFILTEKNGSGFGRYGLKFGLLAKYNKYTENIKPGGGLSGVLGPFTFGYSIYGDETRLNDDLPTEQTLDYQVQTYSAGLFLSSLILDYSHLQLGHSSNSITSDVSIFTASLLWKKFIFTASKRIENSPRQTYNYDTRQLESAVSKEDYFGGVQYSVLNKVMVGALYNYYLLREFSVTTTLFF